MTMSSQIEHLILASVLTDVAFGKKYLPHLGPAYFSSVAGGTILIDVASRLVTNYDCAPSLEQVHVELKDRRGDPEAIQDARELAADPAVAIQKQFKTHGSLLRTCTNLRKSRRPTHRGLQTEPLSS